MFRSSDTYKALDTVLSNVKSLMRTQLTVDFVEYLHGFYTRRDDEAITFLPWLGEQAAFSKIVGGQHPILDMYDILDRTDEIFDREEFRRSIEEHLNRVYGEDNPAKLLVQLELAPYDGSDLRELMTFQYDATWAMND